MAMIEVRNLTKTYGATVAVQGLDFAVERGEIVGFLGPNGAGKTTTMRILAGSLGATEGEALIDGIDVFREPRRVKRRVGYLPEFPPLYTDMTVRGYLRFCGRVKGAADPRGAAERVIEQVGLREVAHRLIDHLSKGFRQRVGIAQALVHDPQVLILDEPASGLDPGQRVEIRELVKRLAEGDVTVILSTHVLPEVEAICRRVVIVHEGRIVAEDAVEALSGGAGRDVRVRVARPTAELRTALAAVPGVIAMQELEPGLFRIDAGEDVREGLAAAAVPGGLLELSSRRRLEEVFLELTGAPASEEAS